MSKPPVPKQPPDLAGAIRSMAAVVRGPRKKSPVNEWLAARYDGLAKAFQTKPPSWKALADYLGDGGVMNADGQRPTPASVRSAWLRVEADVIRKRARRGPSLPDVPSAPTATRSDYDNPPDEDPSLPDFSNPVRG